MCDTEDIRLILRIKRKKYSNGTILNKSQIDRFFSSNWLGKTSGLFQISRSVIRTNYNHGLFHFPIFLWQVCLYDYE